MNLRPKIELAHASLETEIPAISYFDSMADEYNNIAASSRWDSPHILFGLAWRYLKPKDRILDLGIGTGLSSQPFYKAGCSVVGCDGSENMLYVCRRENPKFRLHKVNLEREKFPVNSSSFDCCLANGLIYFLPTLDHFIEEVIRVLKPGGVFACTFELPDSTDSSRSYINTDNSVLSKRIKNSTGVSVTSRSRQEMIGYLCEKGLRPEIDTTFFAYHSPSIKTDRYFGAIVASKQ